MKFLRYLTLGALLFSFALGCDKKESCNPLVKKAEEDASRLCERTIRYNRFMHKGQITHFEDIYNQELRRLSEMHARKLGKQVLETNSSQAQLDSDLYIEACAWGKCNKKAKKIFCNKFRDYLKVAQNLELSIDHNVRDAATLLRARIEEFLNYQCKEELKLNF